MVKVALEKRKAEIAEKCKVDWSIERWLSKLSDALQIAEEKKQTLIIVRILEILGKYVGAYKADNEQIATANQLMLSESAWAAMHGAEVALLKRLASVALPFDVPKGLPEADNAATGLVEANNGIVEGELDVQGQREAENSEARTP